MFAPGAFVKLLTNCVTDWLERGFISALSNSSSSTDNTQTTGLRNACCNYRPPVESEIRALLAFMTLSFGNKCTSATALISLVSSFVAGVGGNAQVPLTLTRYRRLSAAFPSAYCEIDALWEYYSMCSARVLGRAPAVMAVDESIWRRTHVIDDPAEHIIMLMPRKPAGIGVLSYLLAVKLLHSELSLLILGFLATADVMIRHH